MSVQLCCKTTHHFYSIYPAAGRMPAVKDQEIQTLMNNVIGFTDAENTDWLPVFTVDLLIYSLHKSVFMIYYMSTF